MEDKKYHPATARARRHLGPTTGPCITCAVGLKPRELEVVRLAAKGLTYSEMATRMTLQYNTVKVYAIRVLRSLHATTMAQAVCITQERLRHWERNIFEIKTVGGLTGELVAYRETGRAVGPSGERVFGEAMIRLNDATRQNPFTIQDLTRHPDGRVMSTGVAYDLTKEEAFRRWGQK